MIRVFVIDDHPIVTNGLQNLLKDHPEIGLEAHFGTGQSGLDALRETVPDILLLDISLPDINGLQLCKTIHEKYPQVGIVALSLHNERPVVQSMIRNGAKGYVLKNAPGEEIIEAIRCVYQGVHYYCSATREVLDDGSGAEPREIPLITRREKEVLTLIGQGLTTQEVADKLFISPHTVESHRKKLMEKFDVKNIISVIRLANDYGLL